MDLPDLNEFEAHIKRCAEKVIADFRENIMKHRAELDRQRAMKDAADLLVKSAEQGKKSVSLELNDMLIVLPNRYAFPVQQGNDFIVTTCRGDRIRYIAERIED